MCLVLGGNIWMLAHIFSPLVLFSFLGKKGLMRIWYISLPVTAPAVLIDVNVDIAKIVIFHRRCSQEKKKVDESP